MRNKVFLILGLVLVLFTHCSARSGSGTLRCTLLSALKERLVTIEATGSGKSYFQEGLHLRVINQTKNELKLTIDPALIFRPDDTSFQDLILSGETALVLRPSGYEDVDLQTFCGKNYARVPGSELHFRLLGQGDSVMIKVMHFINRYQLYNITGQQAIWALTDTHNLNAIYDQQHPETSNKLVALMALLTGWTVPDYFRVYKINIHAGAPVLEPRVLKILSIFDWKLAAAQSLELGIYNQQGKLIQPVIERRLFSKGSYRITVTFEAANIAKGSYFIRLSDGANIIREQTIELE